MEENILKLQTEDGAYVEIEVLDIINNEKIQRDYIVYRIKGSEDVLISILNQAEKSYSLDKIQDPTEFKELEEYLAMKAEKVNGDKSL